MSRSYKKHPVYVSKLSTVGLSKKWANKKARKSKILDNGNYYRKVYEQWNIIDYKDWLDECAANHRYDRIYSVHNIRFRPVKYVTKKEYIDRYYKPSYKRK